MGNEFLFDDENVFKDNEINSGVKFVALGPRIFQNLRSLHCVDENDITNLFSVSNLLKKKLKVKLQSGKGGAFFVFPQDGRYLIKSINSQEYEVMKEILPDFYMHYLQYPSSFINPIYGCYALYLSESGEIEPQYFVLMKNVLDINKTMLPAGSQMLCFDIKGSSAGRKTLKDPEKLLLGNISEEIQKQTLKDADFLLSFKKLDVTPIQGHSILSQLALDANFFSKYSLIDYSLLLYVINVPYRSYLSNRSGVIHRNEREKGMHAQELILAEKNTQHGKPEIIIEERERATNAVYRIINENDVETLKKIDDTLSKEVGDSDSDSFKDDNDLIRVKARKAISSKVTKVAKENSKRLIINFAKVVSTDSIGKYTIDKGIGEYSSIQAIPEEIKFEDVDYSEENQIIRKKLDIEKVPRFGKGNDVIKISNKGESGGNNEAAAEKNAMPTSTQVFT